MTAIVAVVAGDGSVVMGGDSAGMDDTNLFTALHAEPKVWRQGPTVIGACGVFRVAQVIRFRAQMPSIDPDDDVLEWMVGPFVDSLREALTMGGALTVWDDTSTEELGEAGLVVGVAGHVFEVYTDFGVGELLNGYGVAGCGSGFALGALYATEGRPAEKRVRVALEAAERHSAGVRGPFNIVKLPPL